MTSWASEADLSIAFARYLAIALPEEGGVWWSHIGHGGLRSKASAGKLKAMGLRPGISDYFFCWPGHVGFLELKIGKGRPTPEQINFHKIITACGFSVGVAWSLEEAERILRSWGLAPRYTIGANGMWHRTNE